MRKLPLQNIVWLFKPNITNMLIPVFRNLLKEFHEIWNTSQFPLTAAHYEIVSRNSTGFTKFLRVLATLTNLVITVMPLLCCIDISL